MRERSLKLSTPLLDNASKYAPAETTIRIKQRAKMTWSIAVEMRVLNSFESREKVFERFFRVDGDGSTGGIGLGSQSPGHCASTWGDIRVEIKENMARIVFTVPVGDEDSPREHNQLRTTGLLRRENHDGSRSDFSLLMTNEITLFCGRSIETGYEVRVASEGQAALDLFVA
jgi:hypothetical protein